MTGFIQNVVVALSVGSLYALLGLGLALVFGIMGLINFAHGELIMATGYGVVLLYGLSWPVVVIGAVVVAVMLALASERVAFRPVRRASPTTLLVTSFALSYFLQNLAQLVFGSLAKTTVAFSNLSAPITVGGVSAARLNLVTMVTTLVLLVALGTFLKRTSVGVQMRAAAEDFRMAQILGVRGNRVIAIGFAISGMLAGVAGLLLVAQTGFVSPTVGASPVLIAFIATILGGLGSLRGAVIGGFVLGLVTVALEAYLPLGLRVYRDAFAYSAVIALLVLRPDGLVISRSIVKRV